MSRLFLRGRSVWISYSDKSNTRQRKPTGFQLEKIERRGGRIVWPTEILHFQRRFDQKLIFGKWHIEPRGRPIRISELHKEFLAGYGSTRKPATQYLYSLAIRSLIDHLGDVDARKIDADDMMSYRNWMLERQGDQNASRSLRSLAKMFSWAEERELIARNPITSEHRVTAKTKPIKVFSEEHLEKLLENAKPAMKHQLEFLLLSGFRLGECCALKWEDVDFEGRVIRVWNEKESRWDYFPMDRTLIEFMRGLPKDQEPFVFEGRKVGSVSQYTRRLAERLNLPRGLRVHTLRANFISRLVNAGLSESVVMALARHKSLMTTHKYYVAFDQQELRKGLARSRSERKAKSG